MTNRERPRGGELQESNESRVGRAIANYIVPDQSEEEKNNHRTVLIGLRKEIVMTLHVMNEIETNHPGKSELRTQELERLQSLIEKISNALSAS